MSHQCHLLSEVWQEFGNRSIAGDTDALGSLLEHYRPQLLELADRNLSPSVRSKFGRSDLVQQTCEDAVIGIGQIQARNRHQFWGWLFGLLTKNVVDVHRKYVVSLKRSVRREQTAIPEVRAEESTASGMVMRNESVASVREALHRRPTAHREVLTWRFLEGRSCQEIGTFVDRSTDAVRMMVNRALQRLREELPQDGDAD